MVASAGLAGHRRRHRARHRARHGVRRRHRGPRAGRQRGDVQPLDRHHPVAAGCLPGSPRSRSSRRWRQGAVPRWMGMTSLVLGGLTVRQWRAPDPVHGDRAGRPVGARLSHRLPGRRQAVPWRSPVDDRAWTVHGQDVRDEPAGVRRARALSPYPCCSRPSPACCSRPRPPSTLATPAAGPGIDLAPGSGWTFAAARPGVRAVRGGGAAFRPPAAARAGCSAGSACSGGSTGCRSPACAFGVRADEALRRRGRRAVVPQPLRRVPADDGGGAAADLPDRAIPGGPLGAGRTGRARR